MEIYDYTDDEILTLAKKAFSNLENGVSLVHVEGGAFKASHIINEVAERFKMLRLSHKKKLEELDGSANNNPNGFAIESQINDGDDFVLIEHVRKHVVENSPDRLYLKALSDRLEQSKESCKWLNDTSEAQARRIESLESLLIKALLENN